MQEHDSDYPLQSESPVKRGNPIERSHADSEGHVEKVQSGERTDAIDTEQRLLQWGGAFQISAGKLVCLSCSAIRPCDLLISVRTSGVVQPAASTLATARRAGAVIIHINKDPVNLAAENDISLIGDATALLPTLVAGE